MAALMPGEAGKPWKMEELEEEGDNQNDETCQTGAKEKQPHAPHSVIGYWEGQETEINCKEAKTVEDLLMTSEQFRRFANKNQNKVLVIARDGKPIAPHFPCMLIQEKALTVKYIADTPSGSSHTKNEGPSGETVIFHVRCKGGPGIVKILKYPTIEKDYKEITVYGYKGETVIDSLRRDERFQDKVFKNSALSNINGEARNELSTDVDKLDGKTFKIIQIKTIPSEDVRRITRQQSAKDELVNDNKPKETPQLISRSETPKEIPDSEELQSQLSTQFKKWLKAKMETRHVPRLSRVQNLLRVQYGKNLQTCMEVQMMKRLMFLGDSVCQVRINDRWEGSGFLLFDKYVLTNGHVVKNIYNDVCRQHCESITVHFSFESLGVEDSGVKVKEVAGFEFGRDGSGHMHDWALLKLHDDQNPKPKALLPHCYSIPEKGGICIIGHPNGGVKKIDPCLTVQAQDLPEVVVRHHGNVLLNDCNGPPETIQMVSQQFFEGAAIHFADKSQVLNYETCFYYGSSGSPVFNEYCRVVAMHSGGYGYRNSKQEERSVVEYGYPLTIIIERIMVQLVQRRKFDVLRDYLACDYAQYPKIMNGIKTLVVGRNISLFREAASDPDVTKDETLKEFFNFICQKEGPVPMEH